MFYLQEILKMGKKRRGRSVKKNLNQNIESNDLVQAPHSFVIHRGISGGNTLELTKDFRKVMEPFTAKDLKVLKLIHFIISLFFLTSIFILGKKEKYY